jgi:hypothetical protein
MHRNNQNSASISSSLAQELVCHISPEEFLRQLFFSTVFTVLGNQYALNYQEFDLIFCYLKIFNGLTADDFGADVNLK